MQNFGATVGAIVAFIIGASQGASDPADLMTWAAIGGGLGAVTFGALGSGQEQEEPEDQRASEGPTG